MTITDWSFLDPRIDRRLAADIDAAEANKLVAYQDTLGNWTAGRGHLLPPPAPGRSWQGLTILPATSDRWFNGDLLMAIKTAQGWPEYVQCDTDCRRNALEEIAFNMGSRWHTFVQTRAAMMEQNWQGVKDGLLDSTWAHEVQPDGLDRPGRATRIADYFLTGQYPT
jgi:GH24 family phage-related lysozyme (muramidase)